jgi:hypothetical protein
LKNKIISFSSKFGMPEKFNSQFHKVKIYVAYAGKNRNGSIISKETFEKMIPSIYGIPIVGEWKEEKNDFGSHGGKIEITDEGIEFIDTTKPYGYIDSSANVYWETVVEEDGTEREYLVTEGFLWTGRYPEALNVLDGKNNQSMEITVLDGKMSEEHEGYYEILDAEFSALCILGEEVEPCFESSHISQFSLNKEEFKKEFALMVKELKKSINFSQQKEDEIQGQNQQNKGGENMEVSKFATYNQKREALKNALDPEIIRDNEGNIIEETYYWIVDFDDEYVYVERRHWLQDNYTLDYGRFAYTFDEERNEATITSEFEKMILVWLTEEENQRIQEERNNYQAISKEYEELKQNYNLIEVELKELRKYKANIEKQKLEEQQAELFEQYDELLKDNAEYAIIKENKDNYLIEELEKELALLYVKSNAKFSKKDTKKKIKIGIEPEENNVISSPYGDLTLKFKNKNITN